MKGKEREKSVREFPCKNGTIDLRLAASTSVLRSKAETDEKSMEWLTSRVKRKMLTKDSSNTRGTYPPGDGSEDPSEKSAFTSALQPDCKNVHHEHEVHSGIIKEGEVDAVLPPPYSDAINEFVRDPIQQFSAFPPVTLRNSQKEFTKALEQAMKVLLAQRDYARLCAVVDRSKA